MPLFSAVRHFIPKWMLSRNVTARLARSDTQARKTTNGGRPLIIISAIAVLQEILRDKSSRGCKRRGMCVIRQADTMDGALDVAAVHTSG